MFHTHTRRLYPTWGRAAKVAQNYAFATGWKHKIVRCRGMWRVMQTDRPVRHARPPVEYQFGAVTIAFGGYDPEQARATWRGER